MNLRAEKIMLFAVILAAFVLRLWGIGFGLPFQGHQDEPIVVHHALAYGSGDLNPHFFNIPPFTSYVLFVVYAGVFIAGKLSGLWPSAGEFAVFFLKDPTIFYLAGRFFIGVLPGTLCVLLTYRLASKLLGENASLYAASIMAFAFLNVANSHYIYTDMFLVCFTLAAFGVFLKLYAKPSLFNHCLAGLAIGLAAGAKYNGILLVPTYILVSVLILKREGRFSPKGLLLGGTLAGGLSAVAAFIALNPFSVLDLKGFAASLVSQNGSFGYSGLTHHFAYSLTEGISLPLAFLGLAGIIVLATKGDRGKIFVSFPVVYYLVIVFRGQEFARYVLPLVPFFAVGAAYLIFEAVPHVVKTSLARRVITAAAVLMILPTAVKSVKADMVFASKDTRITAAEWIKNNLPAGTKIACDSTVFRPALRQPYSQLEDKAKFALAQEGLGALKAKKMELMMKAASKDDKGYPLYFMFEDPAVQGQFLDTIPAVPFDVEALKARGIEYVVVNGQVTNRAKETFLSGMWDGAVWVADFSPYPDGEFRTSGDKVDATCIPMSGKELFARNTAGPSLRIYKLK